MLNTSVTDIAAISWGPYRLDLFVRGIDGGVFHKAWDNGRWHPSQTGWEALGGEIVGAPAVASWGPNRLDIVALAPDARVFHKAWDNGRWHPSPTNWESIGGTAGLPSIASWGPNRIDVFAMGSNFDAFHIAWIGTEWSDWEALGGLTTWEGGTRDTRSDPPAARPIVISLGPNRLDIIPTGIESRMLHKVWDGRVQHPSWSSWTVLSGTDVRLHGQPRVTSWGPNRLDIFAWFHDPEELSLFHKAWNGTQWFDWEPLGDLRTGYDVAVTSWGTNRIDIVTVDESGAVIHKAWNNDRWSDWVSLGGQAIGSPAIVSWEPNRLDIFVCGTDGGVWHKAWDGQRWFEWESLGGKLIEIRSAPPVPVGEMIRNITGRWNSANRYKYEIAQSNNSEFTWFISEFNSRGVGRIDGETLRAELPGFNGVLALTGGRITEYGADGLPSKIGWDNKDEFTKVRA